MQSAFCFLSQLIASCSFELRGISPPFHETCQVELFTGVREKSYSPPLFHSTPFRSYFALRFIRANLTIYYFSPPITKDLQESLIVLGMQIE